MELRTGYWGRLKQYEKAGFVPVAICQFPPKGFEGARCKELAPTRETLYSKNWRERFEEEMLDVSVETVVRKLKKLGDKVVLLCFEKNDDDCHRQIVAKKLTESGYPCSEFKAEPLQAIAAQGLLF